jgi:hypothetical protein
MSSQSRQSIARWLGLPFLTVAILACGGSAITASPASPVSPAGSAAPSDVASPSVSEAAPSVVPSPGSSATSLPEVSASPSQEPDTGGLTTAGDVPDNAVFLTYRDAGHGFAIQYVEGWQVKAGSDGVVIRDKDSSETVTVVSLPADLGTYITATDIPALQAQPGFQLVKRDTVKVGSRSYDHLIVHLPAPPDPVTGKQVPSTVDRYYVAGPAGLAIVSLSTPDGVDNVDAFRQMIESFKWS